MKPRDHRPVSPSDYDATLARAYLQSRLASMSADEEQALCDAVGRGVRTVASWKAGRSLPARYLWPRISSVLGEPRDSMFRAALPPERVATPDEPEPETGTAGSAAAGLPGELRELVQRLERLEAHFRAGAPRQHDDISASGPPSPHTVEAVRVQRAIDELVKAIIERHERDAATCEGRPEDYTAEAHDVA